jgi:hypothetical protein
MRGRSAIMLDQRDLLLVIVLAALAVAGVALDLHPLLRSALAIPLVLLLPGYGLVTALLPSLVLPAVERLLLAVGSSIAITILTGLALAGSGLGLSALGWALSLGLTTIVVSGVAWARRVQRGIRGPGFAMTRMPRMGALMMVVALLVVVNVLLGSRLIASEQQNPAPAALWLLPLNDEPLEARMGVRADGDGGPYRVRLSSGGSVLQEHHLELDDGEVWELIVEFSDEVRQRPVVARLYEGTSEAEIRFVVLQPIVDGG